MAYSDWSTSAASNTSVGGVNIAPGMARSDVDNAMRSIMAEAKAALPDAITAKSNGAVGNGTTDDRANVQTSITNADTQNRALLVQAVTGHRIATSPLTIPNYSYIAGEGKDYCSFIADSTAYAVLSNSDTTTPAHVTLKRIATSSGSHGLSLSASNVLESWNIEDCKFVNAGTAGIQCNQMFLISTIHRNLFDSTNKGFKAAAANTNLVSFAWNQFKELGDISIELLGGSEAVSIVGNRFEARNAVADNGKDVIKAEAAKCLWVQGNYFEDTFKNILTETGSTNTVAFISNRFSGQENTGSGFQSETFTSDGVVTFFNNQFQQTSNGATSMLLLGHNTGLRTHASNAYTDNGDHRIRVRSKVISVTASGTAEDLFTFTRSDVTANADNIQSLAGTITVIVQGQTSGGTPVHMTKTQAIIISGFSNTTMDVAPGATGLSEAIYDPSATGASLSIGEKAGATNASVTVAATFTLASFGSAQMTAILDVTPVRFSTTWPHIAVAPVAA